MGLARTPGTRPPATLRFCFYYFREDCFKFLFCLFFSFLPAPPVSRTPPLPPESRYVRRPRETEYPARESGKGWVGGWAMAWVRSPNRNCLKTISNGFVVIYDQRAPVIMVPVNRGKNPFCTRTPHCFRMITDVIGKLVSSSTTQPVIFFFVSRIHRLNLPTQLAS